jgi:hypothetical protein
MRVVFIEKPTKHMEKFYRKLRVEHGSHTVTKYIRVDGSQEETAYMVARVLKEAVRDFAFIEKDDPRAFDNTSMLSEAVESYKALCEL